MSRILVGTFIPLACQVDDGNDALTFDVVVKDFEGVLVGTSKLSSHGRGLYSSRGPLMPDVPYVLVQYIPSDLEKYTIEHERFDSIPKPREPEKHILGHVVKRLKSEIYLGRVTRREKA